MLTPELLTFIKNKRNSAGKNKSEMSDSQITDLLLKAGWKETDIKVALEYDNDSEVPLPPYEPVFKDKEKGYKSLWDAFLHIVMFISLYVSAVSFGSILFEMIDAYYPPYFGYNGYDSYGTMEIEGQLAALIVTLPVFVYLFLKITRDTRVNPEIKSLIARRVLIYFTLTVAFIIVIGTLINVLTNVLAGDFRVNFLLKAVVVFVISGIVFAHYLGEVRSDRKL